MDEVTINQIKYISSRRASKATGYAKDYVGQLVRMGKLDAQRVGRAWYVNEDQMLKFAGKEVSHSSELSLTATSYVPKYGPIVPGTIGNALTKTWTDVKYLEDESPLFPAVHQISDSRDESSGEEITKVSLRIERPTTVFFVGNDVKFSVVTRNKSEIDASSMFDGAVTPRGEVFATNTMYRVADLKFLSFDTARSVLLIATLMLLMPLIS